MADHIADGGQRWDSMKGRLNEGLLRGLAGMGYEFMTPVQQKVLNELPSFSSDCLVQAKTGTGKTIAFLLPALHSLLADPTVPRGQVAILICSPTRELALQIAKECNSVTAQLVPGLECHTAYGGTSKERDLKHFLSGNPKILVATPGRLNDYLNDEYVAGKFANLRTLVLDEADQMLEAGFLVAINDILRRIPPKDKVHWQGMCFSATIPEKVKGVLSKILSKGHTHLSTIDPNETPTIDRILQHSIVVPSNYDVYPALLKLLQTEYASSLHEFKVIVFGTTANGVALMHALFTNLLHGNNPIRVFQLQSCLSQANRTRTTNEFKEAKAGVMFASGVIRRGMDFPNVSHVIHVGLPLNGDEYVHGVGRTARAGNDGRAIILLTQRESFFLKVNKRFPITPYPTSFSGEAIEQQAQEVSEALVKVDEVTKAKSYQAWLGFNKAFMKQLQLDAETLVEEANHYAAAMGCPEPPLIDKRVVGKMGLKGVRGLRLGLVDSSSVNQGRRPGDGNSKPGNNDSEINPHTIKNGDTQRGSGSGRRGRGRGRGGRRGAA